MNHMFLYQSEENSHFECPQCAQHGIIATAHLDFVLKRNEHALITCTNCMARFEPHAPTADRLRVTEAVHDEDIGAPEMALEEAPDEGSDDENSALPDMQQLWQRHETGDEDAMRADPDAALPVWLRPADASEPKD